MSILRLPLLTSFFCLALTTAHAQNAAPTVAPTSTVDWKAIGKPLDDDTKPMVDRYVYLNETTTDKTVGTEKPVLMPDDINEWLSQRIAEAMTFKASDYDQKTILNQRYFTPKGYAEYIASLNSAQLPLVVKQKKYAVSAVVPDPGNLAAKGLRDETDKTIPNAPQKSVYVWQMDMPVTLGYRGTNPSDAKSYKVLLKVELVRIPMKEDGTLVAINGWRMEEYRSTILPPPKPQAPPSTDPSF